MTVRFEGLKTAYEVAGALGLRYDGYGILKYVLKQRGITSIKTEKKVQSLYFDINEWALRWHLFAYKLAFGKWAYVYGAPILEECAFRLLALHLYRETVPHYFRFKDYYFDVPEEKLEEGAAIIRREFVPEATDLPGMVEDVKYLWSKKNPKSLVKEYGEVFQRPEVLLAFSVNARFLAEKFQREFPDPDWGRSYAKQWIAEAYRDLRFQSDNCANWVAMQCAEWRLLVRPEKFATFKTREHALLMFYYLHLYHQPIPCWARVEPFASLWENISPKTKALVAQRFRRKLSEIYIRKSQTKK